jgi:hypothetical protein
VSLLFWSSQYAKLQGDSNKIVEVSASNRSFLIPLRQEKETLYSPGKGTFGGFIPSAGGQIDNIDYESAYLNLLDQQSCENLIVSFPPQYFQPSIFEPQTSFLMQDSVMYIDVNHHVELDGWTEQDMAKNERKKLNQARKAGLVFIPNVNNIDREVCINLLKESRIRLGTRLSMSSSEIIDAIERMPKCYRMVAVYNGKDLAATALLVRLSDTVEYVLYWGDSLKHRHLSPTVFLYTEIIDQLILSAVQILDLGISSLRGVENPGLSRFKTNLGSIKNEKPVFNFTAKF